MWELCYAPLIVLIARRVQATRRSPQQKDSSRTSIFGLGRQSSLYTLRIVQKLHSAPLIEAVAKTISTLASRKTVTGPAPSDPDAEIP
ncbi:hypothetical protein EDB85DRAFT_2001370 [Lactarius pseudohatsudake]|nr:hypothetical protein EDB85DRAFT_2001370 [Lactarius pseudohatsudake]